MGSAQAGSATAVLQAEARSLDEKARLHKRLEALHRREARDARRRLASLEVACRELGIRLVITRGQSPEEDTDR